MITSSLPDLNGSPLPIISPITIHREGVAQLLFNTQRHKESDPDNLPACFLKDVTIQIASVLSSII